jgi:uncharacterized protein YkwD
MKKKQQKKPLHQKIHQHAKLLVVPHAHNKYQPHLIRRTGLIVVVALVLMIQAYSMVTNGGAVLGDKTSITTDQLLAQTNEERESHGLRPLTVDTKLMDAATLKANDMLSSGYWAHTSPSGVTPWQWFKESHYSYSYAGENLAKNFTTTDSVVAAWMHSAEHRENILDSHYQNVGFAVMKGEIKGEDTNLVVAMYGAPKAAGIATASAPTVLAASSVDESFIAQLGTKLQTMAPTVLGSIILLLVVAVVAATAHLYRKKLPKNIQRSWLKHHGAYKAVVMAGLAIVVVTLYSGGQI